MLRLKAATHETRWLLFPLIVVAFSCTAPPLEPGEGGLGGTNSGGAALTTPRLPWRIRAEIATTPAPPPDGCILFFTSTIEGTATYLGRFSGTGATCILDQIAPDPDPPFAPAGPPPYVTANFTNPRWTLTASNGDELWIESIEAVGVISLIDNSLKAEGRHRIVGGTGRFAGATGEAAVGAVNDDGQGPDDFEGRGWIQLQR